MDELIAGPAPVLAELPGGVELLAAANALGALPGVVYVASGSLPDGRLDPLFISPSITELTSWTADEVLADPALWAAFMEEGGRAPAIRAGSSRRGRSERQIRRRDGELRRVRDEWTLLEDAQGLTAVRCGLVSDTTGAVLPSPFPESPAGVGGPLSDSDSRYQWLVEHIPLAAYSFRKVALKSGFFSELYISPRIRELTGHPPAFFNHSGAWTSLVHEDDRELVASPDRYGEPGTSSRIEYRIRHVDGRVIWIRDEATVTEEAGGMLVQGVLADVTDRREAELALDFKARHDALTGLANRGDLRSKLGLALETANATGGSVALLLMDLDLFKEVNDTLGHDVGDRLLIQVGRRLVEAVRTSDLVARLGGDEFAILLPGAEVSGASVVAGNLTRALEPPFVVDGNTITIGGSIGVAAGSGDANLLMRQADLAMYEAKRNRSRIAIFDPWLQEQDIQAGFARLGELRLALERKELIPYFQPWLNLETGTIDTVEALVRWNHPTRGILPPSEFLPLAEQHGLIREVDLAILDAACAQAATWRDVGRGIRVGVNISRPTLMSEEFPTELAASLIRHRLDGTEIELEITENGVLGDPEQAAFFAECLTTLGVRLAIDDFGTGYSSLGQLRKMGISTLKIDRSFVTGVVDSKDDQAIVETVITLGGRLGLTVVAEGVEDRATLEYLRRLGAEYAQGHHICRPVPASIIEQLVDERTAARLGVEGVTAEEVRRAYRLVADSDEVAIFDPLAGIGFGSQPALVALREEAI